MEKYQEIRKKIYTVQFNRWQHILNKYSPYSLIKGIYYIETASLFLFFTQKIIKSPNLITALYILTGVFGAFFILLSSYGVVFYLGLFMVFTKGTFDWADGALARRLNKTSFLGHALDVYGASICDAAFRLTFVYYSLKNYPDYMFLFPIFCFILLIPRFNIFSDFVYLKTIENSPSEGEKKGITITKEVNLIKNNMNKIVKIYNAYISILDERARGIDFLLLILLFDAISNININILLLVISILIILRSCVKYFATTFLAYRIYKEK